MQSCLHHVRRTQHKQGMHEVEGALNLLLYPYYIIRIVCHFNVVLPSEIYASVRSKSFYTENFRIKKQTAIRAIWLIDAKYNKVKIQ